MYSTQWIKRMAATVTVGLLLAVVFAGAAQAGNVTKGLTAQQLKAATARSEAWNRYYHLGAFSKGATAVQQAEERRAQAVNQFYNLGTSGKSAAVQQAEERRAQAMNQFYNLGAFSKGASAVQQAEERRAEAMNRFYNLGTSGKSAGVQQADERRAQAVNRFFHLGSYAVIRESSGFDWTDAGIGAGAMLGAIVLAGGLAVAVRRRTTGKPSVPSTT